MTEEPVSQAELEATRESLMAEIDRRIDEPAMRFLTSLHNGEPDFDTIALPQAANLPAIRWKVQNLQRLQIENPEKHTEQLAELEAHKKTTYPSIKET